MIKTILKRKVLINKHNKGFCEIYVVIRMEYLFGDILTTAVCTE